MRQQAALVVLLLAAACGPAGAATGTPRLEVGTGVVRFEPVTAEEPVPIVCGSQPGQHVWTAVRVFDAPSNLGNVTTSIHDGDDRICWKYIPSVRLDGQGDALELAGSICFIPDPAVVVGRPLTLRAEVEFDELVLTDARTITLVAPATPCDR